VTVRRFSAVQRCPKVNGFLYLDSFLQLRLLELNPYPALQLIDVPRRIESEYADRAAVRSAESFDALHGRGLTGAVGSNETKDLAVENLERDVVDSDEGFVGLSESRDLNDWRRCVGHVASLCALDSSRKPSVASYSTGPMRI